jgi:hypothetical protein
MIYLESELHHLAKMIWLIFGEGKFYHSIQNCKHFQNYKKFINNFYKNREKGPMVKQLCWKGIPSCIRIQVWKLFIGNDLRIRSEQFDFLKQYSRADSRCAEFERLVELDLPRTFPNLMFFCDSNAPLWQPLKDVLVSFAMFRPDIGYVQGMSYIGAMLLMNHPSTQDTFVSFANLISTPFLTNLFKFESSKVTSFAPNFSFSDLLRRALTTLLSLRLSCSRTALLCTRFCGSWRSHLTSFCTNGS